MNTWRKWVLLMGGPLLLIALIYQGLWGFTLSAATGDFRQVAAGTNEVRVLSYTNRPLAILRGVEAQRFVERILLERAAPEYSNGYGVDTKFCFFQGPKLLLTLWPITRDIVIIDTKGPHNQLPDNYKSPARAKPWKVKPGTALFLRRFGR